MNEIQCKPRVSEIISLDKVIGVIDNTATTKLTSVKPNRHSLAIFTPIQSTGVKLSYSDTLVSSVYGGLIEPNTTPFLGNKFSRMLAVVETCQPFLWLVKLTKLTGVFS